MILTHKSKLVIIDSLAIILQKEGKNEKDRDEIILNHVTQNLRMKCFLRFIIYFIIDFYFKICC